MKDLEQPSWIRDVPVGDERWALVQRIVASRHFQKAPKLRDVLLYIVGRTLSEGPVEITEQQIGCDGLGAARL